MPTNLILSGRPILLTAAAQSPYLLTKSKTKQTLERQKQMDF